MITYVFDVNKGADIFKGTQEEVYNFLNTNYNSLDFTHLHVGSIDETITFHLEDSIGPEYLALEWLRSYQSAYPVQTGFEYNFTRVMKAMPTSIYQPNTRVEGDKEIQTFLAKVTSVEDRGDYFYVGYTPSDRRQGSFGYLRINKPQFPSRPYGIVKVEALD